MYVLVWVAGSYPAHKTLVQCTPVNVRRVVTNNYCEYDPDFPPSIQACIKFNHLGPCDQLIKECGMTCYTGSSLFHDLAELGNLFIQQYRLCAISTTEHKKLNSIILYKPRQHSLLRNMIRKYGLWNL